MSEHSTKNDKTSFDRCSTVTSDREAAGRGPSAVGPLIFYDVPGSTRHCTKIFEGKISRTRIDPGHAIEETYINSMGVDPASSELNHDENTSKNGLHLHFSK